MSQAQVRPVKVIGAFTIWVGISVAVICGLWILGQRQKVELTGRPVVVATVPHVAGWLRNILEPEIQVESLIRGGADVHSFTLSPTTVDLLAGARAIVANGAGLEPWLGDIAGQYATTPLIDTSLAVTVDGDDPHIWLDPVRAKDQIEYASVELQKILPSYAAVIAKRTQTYTQQLTQLDQDIAAQVAQLSGKKFVAFHDSFGYFADRYGLVQDIHLVERPDAQVTLQDIAELGQQISRGGYNTIFIEPGPVPDLAQTLADEFGLTLRVLDTLETAPDDAGSYVRIMRENVSQLVQGI